jgi:selenocysteine lyase/cysteine desulfurase
VVWDQNHPTNSTSWDVRAERFGFTVTRVATGSDLYQPFVAAFTPRTRVLAITHASSTTGITLPARELCAEARRRGILTLVDGAQTFGSLAVNLHDMGCDFYTGSAHKWFMGPRETGVLYVRKEQAAALWPNMVGLGWDNARGRGARKFETFGQRDDGAVSAVGRAVEFHNAIGRDRVEARVRALAAQLKARLRDRVPGVQFATPSSPEQSAGIVIFTRPNLDVRAASARLYEMHHITCATAAGNSLRFAPHIYVLMEDIEKAVEAVAAL